MMPFLPAKDLLNIVTEDVELEITQYVTKVNIIILKPKYGEFIYHLIKISNNTIISICQFKFLASF